MPRTSLRATFADSGEQARVARAYTGLHRFLAHLASAAHHAAPPLRTRFLGPAYTLDIVCHAGRLRRITADLCAPFAQRFVIGRLGKDGAARLYACGVRQFLRFLAHERLLHHLARDLEEALRMQEEAPEKYVC